MLGRPYTATRGTSGNSRAADASSGLYEKVDHRERERSRSVDTRIVCEGLALRISAIEQRDDGWARNSFNGPVSVGFSGDGNAAGSKSCLK